MRLVKIDDLNGSEVLAVPIMSAKDQVLIQSDTVESILINCVSIIFHPYT